MPRLFYRIKTDPYDGMAIFIKRMREEVMDIMSDLSLLDWIALILIIVGGLNWGLVGVFGFDLMAVIFGTMSVISRIVYTFVGLAAIYTAVVSTNLRRK